MDHQPTPELEASPEPPPLVSSQKYSVARSSMREELMALFRNTERHRPGGDGPSAPLAELLAEADTAAGLAQTATVPPDTAAGLAGATEPSIFLRRFLRQAARSPRLFPSGLPSLDAHLGGGFRPGAHVLLGPPGAGKTAFLLSLAWDAVSRGVPVLFYSLKDGGLTIWRRLIATVGEMLGEGSLPFDEFYDHQPTPQDLETLARLDGILQTSVLPLLTLVDGVPARPDLPAALLDDVRIHAEDAAERHGRAPILLLDDIESLLLLGADEPAGRALSRLDESLHAESMTGLFTATSTTPDGWSPRNLHVRMVLALRPCDAAPTRIDLDILADARNGGGRLLPLLFDGRTGLFAE
jgi:hypothetical protein